MATLSVWRYDDPAGAEQAAGVLQDLVAREQMTIHDAATVTWEQGRNTPRTRPLGDLTGAGALGGPFWGLLLGTIFFVPLLGAALGAATGAVGGSLADVGIDDTFVNRIRDTVTPGTSALFLLSSDAVVDKVQDAFRGLPTPELLSSNLSLEQEKALIEVFAE